MLVFSTGRNYSHNGRISLDKSLSANKQKGVTRATKLCAHAQGCAVTSMEVLSVDMCSLQLSLLQYPTQTRVTSAQFCPFPHASRFNNKGRESSCRHAQVSRRNQNAAKFTACSHYPCHLSFAIRSISLGVDCRRVKDSLTLLSLAVRPPVCSLQLPAPAHFWVVFIRKNETHAESGATSLKFFRRFRLIKSQRKGESKNWKVIRGSTTLEPTSQTSYCATLATSS